MTRSLAILLLLCSPGWADISLDASVIVRVPDRDGAINTGSGTIIDSRQGHSLIISAGHIFRDAATGKFTVNFRDGSVGTGRVLLWYDHRRGGDPDLALASVDKQVATTAAIARYDVRPGDKVCGVGLFAKHPLSVARVFQSQGHWLTELNGVSISGDSGGGIFNEQGELIGVVSAGDDESVICVNSTELATCVKQLPNAETACYGGRCNQGWQPFPGGGCQTPVYVQSGRPAPQPTPQPATQPAQPQSDWQANCEKQAADIAALRVEIVALKKQVDGYKECQCGDCCKQVAASIDTKIAAAIGGIKIPQPPPPQPPNYDTIAAEVSKRLPPINMRVSDAAPYQPMKLGSYVTLPLDKSNP